MSGDDAALQRALADACLLDGVTDRLANELPAFLLERGVDRDDVAAIAAQPRRIAVYRSLVRNGLSSVVARVLPRTRARMNRTADGRFDRDFAAFVDRPGPRTHYLRDVPGEFVAWAEPRWHADADLPAYLSDLAMHELSAFAVGAAADATGTAPIGQVSLERALAFHASTTIVSYVWRVHDLSDALDADDAPAAGDVTLLGYRDSDHRVRWLELTPMAAAIVSRLRSGATLGDAITSACGAMSATPDTGAIAALLGDLSERGVIVGAVG
jgi:hypothetical protein